ncbi:tyrosine-type recombinase/integrase [Trichlorobacter lovleyi]|uniref:Integrase family protein n=2 Tax=Trichlorobacter lovleyi TaxID=313985 RepID=B3E9U3_TRIL1|nr:integrase arm-type DNA-binding domain-containing protein [Trichlorobacter lovleyi]ACD96818.1 integrase family protein [Trichlorobacter lovleyi SZ]
MPRQNAPLADIQVNKAKKKEKDYKLSDGGGLHLLVTKTGGKLWRMQYRFDGKQKMLSFGAYPAISLADARQRREDARKLLANGQDPAAVKKAVQEAAVVAAASTFAIVAGEWFQKRKPEWVDSHAVSVKGRLDNYILPAFGSKPIVEVTAADVRTMLLKIEARGTIEAAKRVKVICGQVFRYAAAHDLIQHDPSAALKPSELFRKVEKRHFAAVTDPKELAPLLRSIEGYTGSIETRCALRLLPMLLMRPGELRHLEWSEIDREAGQINIPAEKMKMRTAHTVPLCKQALAILEEIRPLTGHGKYVFPSTRSAERPISDNTLNACFRRMGYDSDTVTAHGFRATARTILDEVLGFRPDIIEHQLAHAVKDPNGRAYNRTAFIDDRRKMMQQWSDYLDSLKAGAKVIPISKAA